MPGTPTSCGSRSTGQLGCEALGRSWGGLSTEIHLAADRRCRPVTRILIPGQHGDCPQFIPLLIPSTSPGAARAGPHPARHWLRDPVP
jgi:hypothetical protein